MNKSPKICIVGFLSIMAITMVPFSNETNSNDDKFYGMLTLVKYDENRNEVFSQSVHNQLTDEGETFLLGVSFFDNAADIDDDSSVGSICLTDAVTVGEGEDATAFDLANGITETNCIVDGLSEGYVDITTTQGLAVIGPLTFDAPTHVGNGDTVDGIGICQSNNEAAPWNNCGTAGILFAVVNTVNVTLASTETVDVTYTFNMTSPGS